MMYLGDYPEDHTGLKFTWNTNAIAGESITRATNGTISVYKDGGTTQSTAGITDTEDFDSLTGVHLCAIDLSADAFYVTGSEYSVVLSAATIDGKAINATLAHFSIERAGGVLALLKGANGLSAIKTQTAAIETDTQDLQSRTPVALVSGRMDSSVGAMAANVITAAATAADFTTEVTTGLALEATLATGITYIDTEVAAIKAKTDNLPASPAAVGSAMTLTSAYDFAKGTVAMTEDYAADAATATPAQMLYMLWSLMAEKNIASTTLTAKKLDGSTTAMTFTLDSDTSPTSITRAT